MQSLKNLPAERNPLGLSESQLKALITIPNGQATVTPRYRLLNTQLQPVNRHTPGVTGDFADISDWIDTAKITNDTSQAVCRKLDLTITESNKIDLNTNVHLIQAFVDYWSNAGDLLLEVPVGIFTPTIPDRNLLDQGNTWTITALDLSQWLAQISFLNTWTIPAGMNYVAAVQQLLQLATLPKSLGGLGQTPAGLDCVGAGIDARRIQITPTSYVTPVSIPFGRKDNLLVAINSLLAAINYFPLWVDEIGNFRSSPMPYFYAGIPQLGWTYATDQLSIIVGPVTQQINNQNDIANIVVVECQNNGNDAFVSIQYNISANSSISLTNMGRPVTKYISDDKIPDQPSADLRAFVELQYAALASEIVQFSTVVNPLHQTYDPLGLAITTKDGIPEITGGPNNPFQELSWELDLNAMQMGHVAGRMIPV